MHKIRFAALVPLALFALLLLNSWSGFAAPAAASAQEPLAVAPLASTTFSAAMDTTISEQYPDKNYGKEYSLAVARMAEQRVPYDAWTLLWFDLQELPADAEVISAKLELYQFEFTGAEIYSVRPNAITEGWKEAGVTWNTQPPSTYLKDPATNLDTKDGWKSWDVLHIAQAWASGELRNEGILLYGDGETIGGRQFYSREELAPRLTIEYTVTRPTLTPTRTPTTIPTNTATPFCEGLTSPDQIPSPGLIDFDDLTHGAVIGTSYLAAHGVTFENSDLTRALIYANEPGEAHSPPNVAINDAVAESSANVPMIIDFNAPKTHVGFYLGNGGTLQPTALITAYDAAGAIVCQVRVPGVPEATTLFAGLHDSGGRIWRVTIDYGNTALSEHIDDLYYAPVGPGVSPTPSATPSPTPTATRTPTSTYTPTRTRTPTVTRTPTRTNTPTRTPTPSTDLIADKIEVTQVVQDLNNSVRLVKDKRTFVRLHVHSTTGTHPTWAMLYVERGANATLLGPINPGGQISVRTSPDRATRDHAFLFELPSGYREGTVHITAYVNPLLPWLRPERNPMEWSYANNSISTSVSFETVPSVPLVVYRVGYKVGSTTYYPPTSHRDQLVDWLERAYPLNDLDVTLRSYYYGNGAVNASGDLTTPNCGQVNSALFSKKVWDIVFSSVPWDAHYYGMVSDGAGFMRGCAMDIPAWVASGPTGTGTWGWDFDGSYGDWYGGHELGHTYGRGHANYCGAGGGPAYPYTSGRISPSLTGNTALYGFDIGTQAIYPPTWKDLMTYCDNEWLSDFTYEGLMDFFQDNLSSVQALSDRRLLNQTDRLLVAGTLDVQTGVVQLDPLFILPGAGEIIPPSQGSYAIVLRDGAGTELARYAFTPSALEMGPDPTPGEEPQLLAIRELVPYAAGTARVDIEGPGGLLASVTAGINPPEIAMLSPNGGEVLGGTTVTVSWTANDPDGDVLRYNVQYSRDNGATWEMLAQDIAETSIELEGANVGSTTQGLFRVWASDGIHTTSDTSNGTFTVPNHLPQVAILSPAHGATVAISQTVAFEGSAYDVDTGKMAEEQLTWSSDLDGVLGHGETLAIADLSVGRHTITFAADDGMGGVANDLIMLDVLEDYANLEVPDQLMVSPSLIVLYPLKGETSAILTIENELTAEVLDWSAATDVPWLSINPDSGSTPDEITVEYVDTGLAPGRYAGRVTITSPWADNSPVQVMVEVVIEENQLALPLILRP